MFVKGSVVRKFVLDVSMVLERNGVKPVDYSYFSLVYPDNTDLVLGNIELISSLRGDILSRTPSRKREFDHLIKGFEELWKLTSIISKKEVPEWFRRLARNYFVFKLTGDVSLIDDIREDAMRLVGIHIPIPGIREGVEGVFLVEDFSELKYHDSLRVGDVINYLLARHVHARNLHVDVETGRIILFGEDSGLSVNDLVERLEEQDVFKEVARRLILDYIFNVFPDMWDVKIEEERLGVRGMFGDTKIKLSIKEQLLHDSVASLNLSYKNIVSDIFLLIEDTIHYKKITDINKGELMQRISEFNEKAEKTRKIVEGIADALRKAHYRVYSNKLKNMKKGRIYGFDITPEDDGVRVTISYDASGLNEFTEDPLVNGVLQDGGRDLLYVKVEEKIDNPSDARKVVSLLKKVDKEIEASTGKFKRLLEKYSYMKDFSESKLIALLLVDIFSSSSLKIPPSIVREKGLRFLV